MKVSSYHFVFKEKNMICIISFILLCLFTLICIYKDKKLNFQDSESKSNLSCNLIILFSVLFAISFVGYLVSECVIRADHQIISTKYLKEYEESTTQDSAKYIYTDDNRVYFYIKGSEEKLEYVEGNDIVRCKNMESVFENPDEANNLSIVKKIYMTVDKTIEAPILNKITVVHSNPLLYWLSCDFF